MIPLLQKGWNYKNNFLNKNHTVKLKITLSVHNIRKYESNPTPNDYVKRIQDYKQWERLLVTRKIGKLLQEWGGLIVSQIPRNTLNMKPILHGFQAFFKEFQVTEGEFQKPVYSGLVTTLRQGTFFRKKKQNNAGSISLGTLRQTFLKWRKYVPHNLIIKTVNKLKLTLFEINQHYRNYSILL